jgi:hypothetical protein
VLRDAATDEEFEITYTQLKRSSDAKGADRYFHGVCSFLARSMREHNGVQQIDESWATCRLNSMLWVRCLAMAFIL